MMKYLLLIFILINTIPACENENEAFTFYRLGIDAFNQGNQYAAIDHLEKAYNLCNSNDQIRKNYFNLLVSDGNRSVMNNEYQTARETLTKAYNLDPNNTDVLFLLGYTYYRLHELQKSYDHWQKALDINPSLTKVKKYLAKIEKELNVQSNYKQTEALLFDIRFDYSAVKQELSDLRGHLMNCYREVGQNFNYFPTQTIIVILYGENEFNELWNKNNAIQGLYDGKIRLPVNYQKKSLLRLKSIISHEYTHALVHDLSAGRCPRWIHEGLAGYEESRYVAPNLSSLHHAMKQKRTLTFAELESDVWKRRKFVNLAYTQSFMIMDYIIHRWSQSFIITLLEHLRNGGTFEEIIQNDTNRSLKQLDREWKEYARKKYGL